MFDIIADSACDFTPEMAQKMGVEIVPFYVSLDGEHYRKEGKEIAVREYTSMILLLLSLMATRANTAAPVLTY